MARKTHKSPEEAKQAILDAAESIMSEVGPAGLRISAVAKKAGMAHPNIIHHFGSREGLIAEMAERLGDRATQRVTEAIRVAVSANEEDRLSALTKVLDTAYPGDEGKLSVWLHMSGVESSIKQNMESIVELSHELRRSVDPNANIDDTNRIVMLITLALVGEVVSGPGIKGALGFGAHDNQRANFREWLAALVLNINDQSLNPDSLINKP